MSCKNYNSNFIPGNTVPKLSDDNIINNCDANCNLQLLEDSPINIKTTLNTAINQSHLLISPNNINRDKHRIKFNNQEYNFLLGYIIKGSFHIYNDELFSDRNIRNEFILFYKSNQTQHNLFIHIPVIKNNELEDIENSVVPKVILESNRIKDSSGYLRNSYIPGKFYLNNILPLSKSFFSYSKSNHETHIVYQLDDCIYISNSNKTIIDNLLPEHFGENILTQLCYNSPNANEKPPIFKNTSGATIGVGADEDEIYIECNPTGESGKKIELKKIPNVTKISKEMKEVLDFILKFLIAFIVIKFAWSLPRLISKNSKKNQPPVQQPAK